MTKVFLALDDEITSVIEKIRAAEDSSVTLVVPKGAAILQSAVNIRLIKKKADELKKNLGLVTNDPIGKHLAAQVGLTVYQNIQDVPDTTPHQPAKTDHATSADKKSEVTVTQYSPSAGGDKTKAQTTEPLDSDERSDDQATGKNETASEKEPDSEVIVGKTMETGSEPEPKRKHLSASRRPIPKPKWLLKILILVIVLVLIGGIGAALIIPRATIVIHVPTEAITKSAIFSVDTSIVTPDGTKIPGSFSELTASATGSSKATGKKDVGEKAKGVITVSNSWSSDSQSLPKNSGLVSEKGLVFRTLTDTTVPGATSSIQNGQVVIKPGKVDVAVSADQPGDQYNIGSGNFTIQGYTGDKASKITGQSTKAMAGGTTKQLTVVTQSDIDEAKKQASDNAQTMVLTNLKQSLTKDQLLLDKVTKVEVSTKDPDHKVDDEADTVTVSADAKAKGVLIKVADTEAVLKHLFGEGLAEGKSVILPDLSEVAWVIKTDSDTHYTLTKDIEGQLITHIDIGAAQSAAMAKKKDQATETLQSQYGAKSVEITLSPPGWPIMPLLKHNITVTVTE